MKTKLFALLMLSSILSFGQHYERIVDTTKMWSNLWETASGGPPPYIKITTYVKFSGDTLYDAQACKKVWCATDSLHLNWVLNGFIYEDTNNRVFYHGLADPDPELKLIYDLSAQMGDVIDLNGLLQLTVINVDSVFVFDSFKKRITFTAGPLCPNEFWIEGLGSLGGILTSACGCIMGSINSLLCYNVDGVLHYSNPDYTDCYYYASGISSHTEDAVSIAVSPNPVTSTSVLQINGYENKTLLLDVFNAQGRLIQSTSINGNEPIFINKADYSCGHYFFRISKSSGYIGRGSFIVK